MFVKLYLIALLIFVVMDMVWLKLVAKSFYTRQIGFLMNPKINWVAALLFYLLFIAGLIVFVVTPALNTQSWMQALFRGALFGLITYATYDLTNLATIKNWPLSLTIIDLIWGSVLAGSVSMITVLIALKFGL